MQSFLEGGKRNHFVGQSWEDTENGQNRHIIVYRLQIFQKNEESMSVNVARKVRLYYSADK